MWQGFTTTPCVSGYVVSRPNGNGPNLGVKMASIRANCHTLPPYMHSVSAERLELAFQSALSALDAERSGCCWTGELSSSALSTATAVSGLALVDRHTGGADAHEQL